MNLIPLPYRIIAGALIWLASLAAIGVWQHGSGRDAQARADQVEFDRINAAIAQQKTIAADTYRTAQATIIATLAERDKFKTQLEQDHAKNQADTAALRDKYSGLGLRLPAAEGAGRWPGGAGAVPPAADSAGAQPAASVQLSDATASALRGLAYDADSLADDYRQCYAWATRLR